MAYGDTKRRAHAKEAPVKVLEAPLAEIVAVGTELLGSHRTDTNSLWLRGQLAELGIGLRAKHVVGDDAAALADVVVARCVMPRCWW
jgi:molybdopterin biosynthesis enzyme